MSRRTVTLSVLSAAMLALVLAGPVQAHAQQGPDASGDDGSSSGAAPAPVNPAVGPQDDDSGAASAPAGPASGAGDQSDADAKSVPPPSLPGSHVQPIEAAPADRSSAAMEPTVALFDAINRGDTVAARDAISRGANLDGQNVLGLTPIELAVDLGRNDISFLLLSMRGNVEAAPTPVQAPRASAVLRAPTARGRKPVAPPAATGTAAPAAGFLGFGGRS